MSTTDITPSPLEKFLQRATQLYTLPAVAMDVLQLTGRPNVDAAALTTCIERDPALVGKILKTVNSSMFGTVRDLTDLNQAVALLGIKPLKLLVLGFSLPPKLLSGIERSSLARYWKHALVKAIAARELAPRYDGVDPDDAFLAGLLQDIGMLALLQDLGEPYAEFLDRAREEAADVIMLELQTLGFDHRLLSARMLQSWGLPEALWRAVAVATSVEDDSRPSSPLKSSARLLATADDLALLINQQQPAALAELIQREGEDDLDWWTQLAESIQEQLGQMAELFDLQAGGAEQFDKIIAQAHAQLSQAALEALDSLTSTPEAHAWSETQALERAVASFGAADWDSCDGTPQSASPAAAARSSASAAVACAADPGLLGHIAAAVANCRRRRQPLSLLLIEIDDFEELIFQAGSAVAADLTENVLGRVSALLESGHHALVSGDAQLAVLLQNADRSAAVVAARYLLDLARCGKLSSSAAGQQTLSLSIGIASVALPAKNFPAADLLEAAQRCLFAVQSSGGEGVKSIDIY